MEGKINLWQNVKKGSPKAPDYKGYVVINNEVHEFALWPALNGKGGFSGKYKPKDNTWRNPNAPAGTVFTPKPSTEIDDEIPF